MVKIKFQAKFGEPLAPGLPRNAHRVIRRCKNLKPNKTRCSKFGSLVMSQMSHVTFFRPFPKNVNFQWRFICWRSRQKNVITIYILMLSTQDSRISYWFLKIHLGNSEADPIFHVAKIAIFYFFLSFQGPSLKKPKKIFLTQVAPPKPSREHFGTKARAVLWNLWAKFLQTDKLLFLKKQTNSCFFNLQWRHQQ